MKLTEEVRQKYCLLVTAGCSGRSAAGFVGVTPSAVRHLVLRDAKFAEQVRTAEMHRELKHLQNIRNCGEKSWRASAWYLERINPDDYRARQPDVYTVAQVKETLYGIGSVIASEIPEKKIRIGVMQKLKRLFSRRGQE